jgi:hypothetical protein
MNSYLDFWAPFVLGEADFFQNKGRETFSSSHNDLGTLMINTGLTESFCVSTELWNVQARIWNLAFDIFFDFIYLFLPMLCQKHA